MSDLFCVFGPFGVRTDETCVAGSLDLVRVPEPDPGAAGACIDLRRCQAGNITAERVPLALVRDGEILALAMRIDAHRVHFWAPPSLPVAASLADLSELEQTLRNLFQRHHLALNNFECNQHFPETDQIVTRSWIMDRPLSPSALLPALLEVCETQIPGVMLHPGQELFRLLRRVTVLEPLGGDALVRLARGGRRKKPAWDAPLWTVETFTARGSIWSRQSAEHLVQDLRPYDGPAAVAAVLMRDTAIRVLGEAEEATCRIGLESLETGTLFQFDISRMRGPGGSATIADLRAVASRSPGPISGKECGALCDALQRAMPTTFTTRPIEGEGLPHAIPSLFHPASLRGVS